MRGGKRRDGGAVHPDGCKTTEASIPPILKRQREQRQIENWNREREKILELTEKKYLS